MAAPRVAVRDRVAFAPSPPRAASWSRPASRVGERGQATVELVAALPLVLAVVLAVGSVLAAGAASEAAGAAAHAGAVAILQDGDARAAARQVLVAAQRSRATIELDGRRVTVSVRPDVNPRFLARLLTATRTAHAGPGPVVEPSTTVIRGGDGQGSRPGVPLGRRVRRAADRRDLRAAGQVDRR